MIKIGETAFNAPYKKGVKQIVHRKGEAEKCNQHRHNQRNDTTFIT